jgi:hypothetical protein
MRRRRLLLGVGLLAMLAAGLFWLSFPEPGVTPRNFRRIRNGMLLADVERVLGQPPDDYGPRPVFVLHGEDLYEQEGVTIGRWKGSDCDLKVFFNRDERVCRMISHPPVNETFLDRLGCLLPW